MRALGLVLVVLAVAGLALLWACAWTGNGPKPFAEAARVEARCE